MRPIVILVALGLLVGVALRAGGEEVKSFESLISEAERLWYADDHIGSNRVLDEAIKLYPNRSEPYWRKARNLFDIPEILPRDKKPPREQRMQLYTEVVALADKCASLDPKDGNCSLWKGIGMGRLATTQGILSSAGVMKEMEEVLLKTIELKPSYRSEQGKASALADSYAVLGQFYRIAPDWRLLSLLFGTRGDIEKSVAMNRKAVELEPKRIEHTKELAVSLICAGDKEGKGERSEEGKRILGTIDAMEAMKPTDLIDKDHARMLLADPSLACGYSRDGQQEQSQEAYEKAQNGK